MIETYKRYDGEALGANKVDEEKIGDIPEPPKTHHKNAYAPKPNPHRNRLERSVWPFLDLFQHDTDLHSQHGGEEDEEEGKGEHD